MSTPLRPFSKWPAPVVDAMRRAASSAAPREAVGVLLGPDSDDAPARVMALEGGGHHVFLIDDLAWLSVHKEARERGEAIRGLFHSHVDGPAALSRRDLDEAMLAGRPRLPDADLLVLSVEGSAARAVAHYRFIDDAGFALVERVSLAPSTGV